MAKPSKSKKTLKKITLGEWTYPSPPTDHIKSIKSYTGRLQGVHERTRQRKISAPGCETITEIGWEDVIVERIDIVEKMHSPKGFKNIEETRLFEAMMALAEMRDQITRQLVRFLIENTKEEMLQALDDLNKKEKSCPSDK